MLSGIRAITKIATHPQVRQYSQGNQGRFTKLTNEDVQKLYKAIKGGMSIADVFCVAIGLGTGAGCIYGAHYGFSSGPDIIEKMSCGVIGFFAGGVAGAVLVVTSPATVPLYSIAKCYQLAQRQEENTSEKRVDDQNNQDRQI